VSVALESSAVAEAAASPHDAGRGVETGSQRRRRWALFVGLAVVVVLLDQATKLWVDASFDVASRAIPAGQPGGPTEVVGDLLRIAKTYNDGAIFGLFEAVAPIMAALSLLVIGGITWFEWRHGAAAGTLVTVGLGLLLGAPSATSSTACASARSSTSWTWAWAMPAGTPGTSRMRRSSWVSSCSSRRPCWATGPQPRVRCRPRRHGRPGPGRRRRHGATA